MSTVGIIVVCVYGSLINALLSGYVADQKGYDCSVWGPLTFFYPITFLAVLGLPTKSTNPR